MGEANAMVDCRFCSVRHRPRFLCNPAKGILDAMIERGDSLTMPAVDFPEAPIPVEDMGIGLESGDQLLRQVVVMAGTAEVAGTPQAVVVFTGQGVDGQPLPRWLYIAGDRDMQGLRELVNSRIDLAVTTARQQRSGG